MKRFYYFCYLVVVLCIICMPTSLYGFTCSHFTPGTVITQTVDDPVHNIRVRNIYERDESNQLIGACSYAIGFISSHTSIYEGTISIDTYHIAEDAFQGKDIKQVNILGGCEDILSKSFYGSRITKMTLYPADVELNIHSGAFSHIEDDRLVLSELECRDMVVPNLMENAFNTAGYQATKVYVPSGYLERYKQHPEWGKFANIYEREYPIESFNFTINTSLGIEPGEIIPFSFKCYPAYKRTPILSSSDEGVVKVEDGKFIATGYGFVTLTATCDGKSESINFLVRGRDPEIKEFTFKLNARPDGTLTMGMGEVALVEIDNFPKYLKPEDVVWEDTYYDYVYDPTFTDSNLRIYPQPCNTQAILKTNPKYSSPSYGVRAYIKSHPEIKGTCKIAGKGIVPQSLYLSPTDTVLSVIGEKYQLTIEKEPTRADLYTYFSTNPEVAEVDDQGVVTAKGGGVCQIIARGLGAINEDFVKAEAVSNVVVDVIKLEKIVLSQDSINISEANGREILWIEELIPENPSYNIFEWSTSDPEIVTLAPYGGFFYKNYRSCNFFKEGEAEIKVQNGEGVTAVCKVSVKYPVPVESVKPRKTQMILAPKLQESLILDFTPTNATEQKIKWEIYGNNVASISSDGVVTGRDPGRTTFRGMASNGDMVEFEVVVLPAPESIELECEGDTEELYTGEEITVKANMSPSDCYKELTWSTNNIKNMEIIKVDSSEAVFRPLKSGNYTIRAVAYNEKEAQINLNVLQGVDSIRFDKEVYYLQSVYRYKILPHIYPETAYNKEIKLKSLDESIAVIYENEYIQVKGDSGRTTIVAEAHNGVKDSFELIIGVEPSSLPTFSPESGTEVDEDGVWVTINAGEKARIYYTLDGSDPDIFFSKVYSGPIYIDDERTIKAIAYENGKSPSPIATAFFPYIGKDLVTSLADFIEYGKQDTSKVFKFRGEAVVTYQNGPRLFMQDETGAIMIYSNKMPSLSTGDIISAINGTFKIYNSLNEMIPDESTLECKGSVDFIPEIFEISEVTPSIQNRCIRIENVQYHDGMIEDRMYNSLSVNNLFGIRMFSFFDGDIVGIVNYYGRGNVSPMLQLCPIYYEDAETSQIEKIIEVKGNTIMAPSDAHIYNTMGLEVQGENLEKGIYIVRYKDNSKIIRIE